jgi:hypothetical protein
MTFPYDPFGAFGAIFGILIVVILASCVIQIAIAVWVYNDAKKRNMEPAMWLAITLLAGCIGCIIYLVVRDPIPTESVPVAKDSYEAQSEAPELEKGVFCSNCGTEIPAGAKFCPSCGSPR